MSGSGLVLPVVHINGTAKQSLIDDICKAGGAVRAAMEALGQAAPNGRDYYPAGDAVFRQARAQHDARLAALRGVYDELSQLAAGVDAL